MKKLEGKVAIVSGSGRGIGRAIAMKLASEAPSVVVNDLDADRPKQTVADHPRRRRPGRGLRRQRHRRRLCRAFVATAVDTFGGLDIIVNNAGYTWDNVIQKMTDEQWDAILDVHLTAPFRILRAASRLSAKARPRPRPTRRQGSVPQGGQHLVDLRHRSATPARPTTRPPRPASSA
jgi:3-oxoacyl-[acyl-carrier protein] reductase